MRCNHGQGKEASSATREATKGSDGLLHGPRGRDTVMGRWPGDAHAGPVTGVAAGRRQRVAPARASTAGRTTPPAPRRCLIYGGAPGTRSSSCRLKEKLGNVSWYKQMTQSLQKQ